MVALPLIALLIQITLVLYVLSLFMRLVVAVERIAKKLDQQ